MGAGTLRLPTGVARELRPSLPAPLMTEPSATGPPTGPEDDTDGDAEPALVDAPAWARLLLVLTPFLVGGLVILLLRALAG